MAKQTKQVDFGEEILKAIKDKVAQVPMGDALSSITALGGAALKATGAVGAAVGALTGLVAASRSFVQALNPAAVMVLDQVMRDLNATIGVALLPIVQAAASYFRELGSVLLPIMQDLAPMVERVTEVFLTLASQGLANMANMFEAILPLVDVIVELVEILGALMAPINQLTSLILTLLKPSLLALGFVLKAITSTIKFFVDLMAPVLDAMRVMQAVINGVAEMVRQFIAALLPGVGLGDVTKNLRSAFQALLKGLIIVIGTLARFVGATAFLDGFIKGLKGGRRQDNTGQAALQNAAFKSFSDFGKDVALAAVQAGQGQKQKTGEQWLEEAVKELQQIRQKPIDYSQLKEIIKTAFSEALDAAKQKAGQAAYSAVTSSTTQGTVNAALGAITLNPLQILLGTAQALRR